MTHVTVQTPHETVFITCSLRATQCVLTLLSAPFHGFCSRAQGNNVWEQSVYPLLPGSRDVIRWERCDYYVVLHTVAAWTRANALRQNVARPILLEIYARFERRSRIVNTFAFQRGGIDDLDVLKIEVPHEVLVKLTKCVQLSKGDKRCEGILTALSHCILEICVCCLWFTKI